MLKINQLNNDVTIKILNELEMLDLRNIAQVSRFFNGIINRKHFWKKKLLELGISHQVIEDKIWNSLKINGAESFTDESFKACYERAKRLYIEVCRA